MGANVQRIAVSTSILVEHIGRLRNKAKAQAARASPFPQIKQVACREAPHLQSAFESSGLGFSPERKISAMSQTRQKEPCAASVRSREEASRECDASPIWQAAIDKYYEELRRGGVKGPSIDQDVWSVHSPDDLLQQIHDLVPADSPTSGNWMRHSRRLEPILLSLNDFAAVITLALGMNGQVAAVIWGSMRLILKVGYCESLETLFWYHPLTASVCATSPP